MRVVDEESLDSFERKILGKIFASICVDGAYQRRMKQELYDDVQLVLLSRKYLVP